STSGTTLPRVSRGGMDVMSPPRFAIEKHPHFVNDARDEIREERRRPYRVPGRRQRSDGPGAHPGALHARRAPVGRAELRAVPEPPGLVLSADRVRRTRSWPVGPGARAAADGGADR